MSEFSAWVSLSVDSRNLHELRGHIVVGEVTVPLAQHENVLLSLQHFCYLPVLSYVLFSRSHLDALRQQLDIFYQGFPIGLHLLVQYGRFLVRKPD